MEPYDWSEESYFRELWLVEGGTSYLHNLLLRRSGFTATRAYLDGIAASVASDRLRPGNVEQSPAECSFDAWLQRRSGSGKGYNFDTDIYARGAAVSLLLDLELRRRSGSSLDSLMRLLLRRFPLGSGGYTLDDVRSASVELGGEDMHDVFDRYIEGSEPLPWETALAYAGLVLRPADTSRVPWLGIVSADEDGRTFARVVVAGSPAYVGGISAGDEIAALDGYRASSAELTDRVARLAPGDSVTLTLFREERLRTVTLRLGVSPPTRYTLTHSGNPTRRQKKLYESWLHEPWPSGGGPKTTPAPPR
jgi:predicted metalloprotease with PDZ domain